MPNGAAAWFGESQKDHFDLPRESVATLSFFAITYSSTLRSNSMEVLSES